MAATKAATGASDKPATAASPARGLWQAPFFVVGVGALVAMAAMRPLAPKDHSLPVKRDLAQARRLLDKPDGDAAEAAKLAEHALEEADAVPDRAAEGHFLLGCALLRLAGQAEAGQAEDQWETARRHLEVAEQLKVTETDRVQLQYSLGKVGYYTHDDPQRVITRLKATVDQLPAEQVEGYRLLTEAYLRLPKPDVQAALACNKKLRNLPQAKEDVLAPARLLGGELLLRLGQADEARKTLEKVGSQAPAEIQAKARLLRARSFQDENHWAEASALWQAALADAAERGPILYNLGVCARRLDQPAEAARQWQECVNAGAGDESQAAALALAEVRLQGPNPETALEMLTRAVEKVKSPADWNNPLIDAATARQRFVDAAEIYTRGKHFDLALKLAGPYAKLAEPGKAAVLRAEAACEWARVRQDLARQASTPEAKQAEEAAARDLSREAALAYLEAADQTDKPEAQAEYLWLSSTRSRDAGDLPQVAAKLERYLSLAAADDKEFPPHKGEAWYVLAEARRKAKDPAGALSAYRESMKYATPFAYRARYQLALAAMDKGELDEAEAALELNLKLLRTDPDPEAQEKSLFALGNLFFMRKNYRMVVRRLEEALGKFPANPEATRAHYQLAESYRQLADQTRLDDAVGGEQKSKEATQARLKEHRRFLQKAADEYLVLARFLDTPEAQGHLKPEEQVQVPFTAADCLFDLGQYNDALQVYDELVKRYPNRLEGLNALGGTVRCYSALEDKEKMRARLVEIETLLHTMPEQVQQQWSEWLTIARKPAAQ